MYEKVVLPSGLRVMLVPMRDVRSVTCTVFVGAGSRYEKQEISGMSHFLEHMFFKGTTRRPSALAISEEVDAIGGEFNAGTSKEYTIFYIKARSEHLSLCVDVLSDMIQNALFSAEELEREKGVILEELKMYEDMPMRDIGEIFEQTMWGDQPLGWKTVGNKKSIKATTRESMVGYKESLYTLDNIIVGLAGDFEPKAALKAIEQSLEDLPAARTTSYLPVAESQKAPIFNFVSKETEQAHLCLGARGFDKTDKDRYVAKVMNVILGGNMSSRLFIAVRERQGLCYYIHSSVGSYHDTGEFDIQAGVDTTRIPQAVEAIIREVRTIRDEKVTAKELHKAKEYIKGKTVLSLEDSSDVIQYYGMQELLDGQVLTLDEKFRLIDQVTADDIQKYAARLFTDDRLNCALIAPPSAVNLEQLNKLLHYA